jgi:hypothetical protein
MGKKYDVVAVTGKYTDRDGNEKSRYLNIGAIIETRNGHMLKLEAVPVGWDGWAYLNEPKEREERGGGSPSGRQRTRAEADAPPADDFDDSIPF